MDSIESQSLWDGNILEEQTNLTLSDICRACAVQAEYIIELVEEGILVPTGRERLYWHFSGIHIHRTTISLRLQRDLGLNLPGVALALQLLEEIETLRVQLRVMKIK